MNSNNTGYSARKWYSAVKAKLDLGMPRERAILQVEKEDPELRQRFLEEINVHKTQPRRY